MFLKFLEIFFIFFVLLRLLKTENLSNLKVFVCSFIRDEVSRNSHIRTILVLDLNHTFPVNFQEQILACLPENLAKVIMDSKDFYTIDSSLPLPVLLETDVIRQKMALKPQLILYIANSIEEVK